MKNAKLVALGAQIAFVALIGWTIAACDNHDDATSAPSATASSAPSVPPPPTEASSAPAVVVPPAPPTAAMVYPLRCMMCHGPAGKGDGKMSAQRTPKPRDYSDPKWQKSVTDEQLRKVIVGGGAAVGKSSVMPANADLASQPELLNGFVALIRSWGAPKSAAPDSGK